MTDAQTTFPLPLCSIVAVTKIILTEIYLNHWKLTVIAVLGNCEIEILGLDEK